MVKASCLSEDFEQLPNRDMTKVGEMGQILSGGQRSRISLARALYRQDSSIVLIDGALASLDARVTRHILDNLLTGDLTKDKLVMVVCYDGDQAKEFDFILNVDKE